MALFGKQKNDEICVNFAHGEGLPHYGPGLAISATVTPTSVVFKPRIGKMPQPVILPREKIQSVAVGKDTDLLMQDKSVLGRAGGQLIRSAGKDFVVIYYDGGAIALEIVGASIGWGNFVKALRPAAPDGPITL